MDSCCFQTDPAHDRSVDDEVNPKSSRERQLRKSDIMGISRIEIAFEELKYRSMALKIGSMAKIKKDSYRKSSDVYSVRDDSAGDEDEADSQGKVCLYTVLPQKSKIVDDTLLLNKVCGAEGEC